MYKHTFYYFLGNKKYPGIYILQAKAYFSTSKVSPFPQATIELGYTWPNFMSMKGFCKSIYVRICVREEENSPHLPKTENIYHSP